MSAGITSLLVTTLYVWSLLGLSLALRMEATPNPWNEIISPDLEISCLVDAQTASSQDVVVIQIGRPQEKPIVVMDTKRGLTLGPEASSKMKGDGHIDNGNGRSQVEITINQPGSEDMGTYQCSMFYLDPSYQLKEERAAVNITMSDIDSESVSSISMAKLAALEKVVHQQETEIAQMKKDNLKQASELEADILQLKASNQKQQLELQTHTAKKEKELGLLTSQVAGLKDDYLDQSIQVAMMNARVGGLNKTIVGKMFESTNVPGRQETDPIAFSMRYSQDYGKLQAGAIIHFYHKLLNLGQGYSPEDGKFTAPVRGVYVFHLVVSTSSYGQGELWVELYQNNVEKADLYAYDEMVWDQSSVTVVLSLQRGDTVYPKLYRVPKNNEAWDLGSVFSGFLLYKM